MTEPVLKKQIFYASFFSRILASLIDAALATIVLLPLFGAFGQIVYKDGNPAEKMLPWMQEALQEEKALVKGVKAFFSDERVLAFQAENQILERLAADYIFQVVVFFIVVLLFWVYKSATPGKMLLSMRIVDAETFEAPSHKQYILRFFGYFLSVIPLSLGFFWIALDKRKQGWHDKLAGTVVIKK